MGRWGVLGRLADLIWPHVCEVCGCSLVDGEDVMCLGCRLRLPRTGVHNDTFGIIHHQLAGKVPVERTAGYFYYYRGSAYARLIYAAKYNGRPRVARALAAEYASEIAEDGFFEGVDSVIPVPLHRFKLWRRGYNQSYYIARGISDVTGIPVAHNLVACRSHGTQTRRGAYLRWLNARGVYAAVNPAELDGKHVLIVDDVLTTGATMLACCEAIHAAAPTARISVLVLAVARMS